MRCPLQYKILVAFTAVVLIVLAGVSFGISLLIRNYFIGVKEQELANKGYELSRTVNDYYSGQITHAQLNRFVYSVDSFLDARVWVVDKQLNLISVSEERRDDGSAGHRSVPVKRSPMGMMEECDWPPPSQQQNDQPPKQDKGMEECDASVGSIPTAGLINRWQGMMHGMWSPGKTSVDWQSKQTVKVSNQLPLQLGGGSGGKKQIQQMGLADIKGMAEVIKKIEAAAGKPWSVTYYHPYYEENMLVVAVPLQDANGVSAGTVLLNAPIENLDWFLRKIYFYIAAAGFAAFLLSLLFANRLAISIVRPLQAMQQTAAAMAQGQYDARVNITTKDEVEDLGRSINGLAHDLSQFVAKTEALDKTRRDFVANVSHELKTPLTIMSGYADALLDGAVQNPASVSRYHRIIRDEALRLEKLITELLDLSALQLLDTPPEMEEVSLAEIVENTALMLKPRSEEKGIKLELDITGDIPPILGNGDRLTQLILIFLDNALKFTPAGGIVTASLKVEGATEMLTISDTGIGISASDLSHIWERFYKADKSRTRKSGGTGLGLAIAKEIIQIHGAVVDVKSKPGQGTQFIIQFPLNM